MRLRVGRLGGRAVAASAARRAAASALMGWVIWGLQARWFPPLQAGFVVRAVALTAIIAVGLLTYLVAAALLRAPELGELRQLRQRRRRK